MTVEDSIVFGLVLGIAFWAAALGGIAILGAWLLVMFGAKVPAFGDMEMQVMKTVPGAGPSISAPAEEGGQLDEWDTNRLDRVA